MKNGMFLIILMCLFFEFLSAQTWIFPSTRPQVETPIVINPTNPDNLLGAAITNYLSQNQISYFYSFDRGHSPGQV